MTNSLARSTKADTNFSIIERWIKTLEPATQDCPLPENMPLTTPLSAASKSASSKTIFGDLPPNSSTTGFSKAPALAAILFPATGPPVKLIMPIYGCSTINRPISEAPVMTDKTPGGKPASSPMRAYSSAMRGVTSDGLSITQFPAASAGAILLASSKAGEFQGVIKPTIPMGSLTAIDI